LLLQYPRDLNFEQSVAVSAHAGVVGDGIGLSVLTVPPSHIPQDLLQYFSMNFLAEPLALHHPRACLDLQLLFLSAHASIGSSDKTTVAQIPSNSHARVAITATSP